MTEPTIKRDQRSLIGSKSEMSQMFWSLTVVASLFAIIFILTRPQSD
jgi:hypothetical protein